MRELLFITPADNCLSMHDVHMENAPPGDNATPRAAYVWKRARRENRIFSVETSARIRSFYFSSPLVDIAAFREAV